MKLIAYIFLVIMSSAMVLPVLGNNNLAIYKSCMGKCCPKKKSENKQSENKECNPFLACSLSAWLQSPKVAVSHPVRFNFKQQYFLYNDNRVFKHLSSLFHPPNGV